MEGILIVNKPQNITSHDVVNIVRRRLKIKKVGHAGTLDPLATGVLIILVGRATRLFKTFTDFDKVYEATLTLGAITDTADSRGKILKTFSYDGVREEKVKEVFSDFTGKINQIPPMVSALKYKGQPLYKLARSGIEVPRLARQITIHSLKLLGFHLPDIVFEVRCSKGTYVRTLGEDIAKGLGGGGHISSIKRINVGPFSIKDSISVEEVNESHLRPWKENQKS
ncbi:MAG: tRNA pseudouridine(55) synthase TruB [Candidatus Omnitrophota bacterium]|nr:tRNA pseudouridine(55) synthase TruB [Candidatus Omnitrophota bacterium]